MQYKKNFSHDNEAKADYSNDDMCFSHGTKQVSSFFQLIVL